MEVGLDTKLELMKVLKWRQKRIETAKQFPQDELYIQPAFLEDHLFFKVFCFVLTSLFVFAFSLAVSLLFLECYKYYKRTKVYSVVKEKWNPPPAYDSVIKKDQKLLPSYAQACDTFV